MTGAKLHLINFSRKMEKGFTFLEVILSITILSIGLLGISSLTMTVIKSSTLARDRTAAITLASDKMEELTLAPISSALLTDTTTANNGSFNDLIGTTIRDYADSNNPLDDKGGTTGKRYFYRYWNIANNFNLYPNTKTFVAIVTWSRHGKDHKVYLTSIKG